MATAVGRFDGTLEVLLHDPARLAATYLADLGQLLMARLHELLAPPLDLLFLPGLLLLLVRPATRLGVVFALIFLAQLLLVNMMAFDPRYFLFLVPLLGAGVGELSVRLVGDQEPVPARRLLIAALAACCLARGIFASGGARRDLQGQADRARELAEVLPAARAAVPPGGSVVSRKPHLAFYLGAPLLGFPLVRTFDDLRALRRW